MSKLVWSHNGAGNRVVCVDADGIVIEKTRRFRPTRGGNNRESFLSTNHDKNDCHPVIHFKEYDNEVHAREVADLHRRSFGPGYSVRVHERVIKVDSMNLTRWFVVVRLA